MSTYDGLARFDGLKFKTYNQSTNPEFPTNSLFNLIEDRNGNLWLATNGGGVMKMVDETFTLIPENKFLHNSTITSLAEDKLGQIWVAIHIYPLFAFKWFMIELLGRPSSIPQWSIVNWLKAFVVSKAGA